MTRYASHTVKPVSTDDRPALRAASDVVRDLAALTKPRITLMVLLTAAGGMWLAPEAVSPANMLAALLSIALVVSAANSLNCYVERDLDGLMRRTRDRPLPAGRMQPKHAFFFSLVLVSFAALALSWLVNPATFALGAVSLFLYVAVYTPLKQHSPLAPVRGCGAGGDASSDGVDRGHRPSRLGWAGALWGPVLLADSTLFGDRHLPLAGVHAAGHQVLPAVSGRRASYVQALVWAAVLAGVSLTLEPLGVVSHVYSWFAAGLALAFFTVTAVELRPSRATWAPGGRFGRRWCTCPYGWSVWLPRRNDGWARWLTAASVILLASCNGWRATDDEPLPELGTLPSFALLDHRAQAFGDSQLKGRISVVSFVFTRCQTVCPLITERTKRLRAELVRKDWNAADSIPRLQLLAISVDPEHDQPAALRRFRSDSGVDDGGPIPWFHLTGDASALGELVVKGFRTALGEPQARQEGGIEILHSSHFVLVDTEGVLRGFFRSDEAGVSDLLAAIERLRRSG